MFGKYLENAKIKKLEAQVEVSNQALEDAFKEIDKLNKILDSKTEKYLSNIEALEQHKIYTVQVETMEEADYFITIYDDLKRKIHWTVPKILVTTKPIKELKIDQLKNILKTLDKCTDL